jgi:dihydrofolate synthase/folylpolyglutamate synthase
MEVILGRCAEVGVAPVIVDQRTHSLPLAFSPGSLGLRGRHQVENAAVAIGVISLLREKYLISDDDIDAGIGNARHPGRLEYQGRYLFDGAHNLGGARALAEYLKEFERPPITLVFGAMEDKPVREMLELLVPRVDKIILTQSANQRSAHFERTFDLTGISKEKIFITDDVEKALVTAGSITREGTILITGSLYLVGEAMCELKNVR